MHCVLQIQILWISWYTKLLIVVTDSCHRLFHRFGICSNSSGYLLGKKMSSLILNNSGCYYPFVKNCHPFERFGLSVSKDCHLLKENCRPFELLKLSVTKQCQLHYCSKPLSPEPFVTNLSKNVNNSSKSCLPSPHRFSRYIFRWIAFFALITFHYRYKFYSRLSYNIPQIPEQVIFWPFCMLISNA